jgi:hypothetical protein
MLIGSSLDEVWGKGILKKKKKTKKKPDTIDDEILIPDTNRLKHTDIKHQINDNEFKYPGYDSSFDNTISSYSSNYDNIIDDNNSYIQKEQNTLPETDTIKEQPKPKTVTILESDYNDLVENKSKVIEGFNNTSDEQFHLLLLYIFTGIFFLMSMDTMYQLGKKSY